MKHSHKLSLALTTLLVGFAAPSFAIPVVFDLAGTVKSRTIYDAATGTNTSDNTLVGQTFNAQLVVETDRFPPGSVTDAFSFRDLFLNTGFAAPSPWSSSLTIAGTPIDVAVNDLNYAYIDLQDSKGPISCGPGCTTQANDSLTLVARSDRSGPLGVTNSSLLALLAYDPADPSYINLDQPFSADSLLTIPLPNLQLNYGTSFFDCQALNLCFVGGADNFWFDVTSVTRSIQGATAVPEPGSFALFASALFGLFLVARRRNSALAQAHAGNRSGGVY